MKPAPELIVIDLDGTLVDSAPDLADSVDALLEKLNRPPAGIDKHKPNPYPLLKTAERFRVDPERCLMVGDSENNVQAARTTGFGIVCVPYGYCNCERIEDLQPDGVVRTLAGLPSFLRSGDYS